MKRALRFVRGNLFIIALIVALFSFAIATSALLKEDAKVKKENKSLTAQLAKAKAKRADLNGDGHVDIEDMGLMLSSYDKAAIPKP